jgi:hypothetical protein
MQAQRNENSLEAVLRGEVGRNINKKQIFEEVEFRNLLTLHNLGVLLMH